jgi:iron complex transport system permease protein
MSKALSSGQWVRRRAIRNFTVILILVVLLVLSFIVSMNTGYTKLSPLDTLRTLFGGGSARENLILFDLRLPRVVVSILVGAGLALSGCIIQGITRNPLADPGLLGINAGAGLMVVLYILFFGARTLGAAFALPVLALAGAGLTAALIYTLAFKRHEGIAPLRLILTGIAVGAGITALMTVLVIRLDDSQYEFIATWQAGSIWGANWNLIIAMLPWLCMLIPYSMTKARILDILNIGDDTAVGLGMKVEHERRILLGTAVALAAVSVAVSGSISFIGLIAPHLARKLVGPKHRILIPACALSGSVIVSVSDTIARVIVQPKEIPTGLMVAVIGAPYFLYLLATSKSK